jgi:[acyl-carrier-protein] S-malonyltransferase
MSYAIVFPGQGAQEIGMGKDFYDSYSVSREVFDEADKALGFPLSEIIFAGTDEELTKTAITQPALLTMGIAAMTAFDEELGRSGKKPEPAFYAGHSLGEYTALVASGVLSLADAVRLVHKRGQLMQSAVPIGRGAMAAVLGLDIDALADICREAGGVCGPANVNAPGQVVISGETEAVEKAGTLAKERGALKVVPLKVSAPFHCELMRPVADELEKEFGMLEWNDPSAPIVANADSSLLLKAGAIREALYRQTYSPVLWANGVKVMESAGVRLFLEFGPGSVLSGLIKRTVKGIKTQTVGKLADMAKAIGAIEGVPA